jgi:thiamine biosynthesis lipoprotein
MAASEARESFACFGAQCDVLVGAGSAGGHAAASRAARLARGKLEEWHARFSRFIPDSELSRLNADARETVPVSALMARFAQAVIDAGSLSGGLVDGTLVEEIETAGYVRDLREPLALAVALALAAARRPASAAPVARWREVAVDLERSTVTRPPGVRLDSGGIAKGLLADLLADVLAPHASFAVDCAGDLVVGGTAGEARAIHVQSPFDESTLHTFHARRTAVATSGIGRRSWLDPDGLPAHHLLDPATGRPAFTGIVQATALAPSALVAEIRAKAALLSGPGGAHAWLSHGGLLVFDDGSHLVIDPPPLPGEQMRTQPRVTFSGPGSDWVRSGRLITASRHNARRASDTDSQRDRSRLRACAGGGGRA